MAAMNRILMSLALALVAPACAAKMHADPVEWQVGDKTFQGVLVYDDAGAAKRPGLLMVPDWKGMTDAAVAQARHIAGDDYVVLVADVWGKGTQPKDNTEAGKMAGALRDDPAELRARINQALAVLRDNAAGAPLDTTKLAALCWCSTVPTTAARPAMSPGSSRRWMRRARTGSSWISATRCTASRYRKRTIRRAAFTTRCPRSAPSAWRMPFSTRCSPRID